MSSQMASQMQQLEESCTHQEKQRITNQIHSNEERIPKQMLQRNQQNHQYSRSQSEIQQLKRPGPSSQTAPPQLQSENADQQRLKETENLQLKLKIESNKIIAWHTKREVEFCEMVRKLKESEEISQNQRKNLLELQMHCEQLTEAYRDEIRNQEELDSRIIHTRQICSILQTHYEEIGVTLESFIISKDNLSKTNTQLSKKFDELVKKYEDVHNKFISETTNLKLLLTKEREQRINDINETNKIHSLLENKIDEANATLHKEQKKYEILEQELMKKNNYIKELTETKEKVSKELMGKCLALKQQLDAAFSEKDDLVKEVHQMHIIKENMSKVEDSFKTLQLEAKSTEDKLEASLSSLKIMELENAENKMQLQKVTEEKAFVMEEYGKVKQEVKEITDKFDAEISLNENVNKELQHWKLSFENKSEQLKELQAKYESEIEHLKNIVEEDAKDKENIQLKLKEFEVLHTMMNEQLESSHKKVQQFEEENQELKKAAVTNGNKIENLSTYVEELKIERDKIHRLLSENNKALNESLGKLDKISNEKESLEKKVKELQEEVTKVTTEGCRKIKEMLAEIQECTLRFNSQMKVHEEDRKKLQGKLDSLTDSLNEANNSKDLAKAEAHSYKDIITQLEQQIEIMSKETKRLQNELTEEKKKSSALPLSQDGSGRVVSSKTTNENSPRGIIKPLGNTCRNVPRKRVLFEDWSDTTDDSSVDVNPFIADRNGKTKVNIDKTKDTDAVIQTEVEPRTKKGRSEENLSGLQVAKQNINSMYTQAKRNLIHNNAGKKLLKNH